MHAHILLKILGVIQMQLRRRRRFHDFVTTSVNAVAVAIALLRAGFAKQSGRLTLNSAGKENENGAGG